MSRLFQMVGALVWSGLTAFFYDYPIHHRQRVINYVLGRNVAGLVAPDSVLFAVLVIDSLMGLVETPKVRMAFPARDQFKDFRALVDFCLARGNPVYAAYPPRVWGRLQHVGTLSSYRVTPLLSAPSFMLAQIRLE
jgi:hypothetical protein